jgi:SNF2 family DNA or RNA helicase
MIVLHGAFREDGLWLWGERPRPEVSEPPSRRVKPVRIGRSSRGTSSPYDAGEAALADALSAAGLRTERRPRFEQATGWLPTVAGQPVASSPLIDEPPAGEPTLRPWTLTVCALALPEAIDLLCACIGKAALAPGVFVGKDLAYASAALQLAAGLVARQQHLPGLRETDGVFRAAWIPVLEGPDAERFDKLARAMPAACRALAAGSSASADAPRAHPSSLLRAFVEATVDRLVRTAPRQDTAPRIRSLDSVHDQWLDALVSADGAMRAAPAELAQFASQIRDWRRPVVSVATAPFRLTLRLEEPAVAGDEATRNGGGPWHVRYLLQATRDPSLLVPAEDVWADRARRALRHEGFDAKGHLLGSLGQASRIDPRIEKSLGRRAPAGYDADATGAYEFLSRSSMELEQAGFGVLLPAWWTRTGTRARLTVKATVTSPKLKSESGVGLEELVKFDWKVALGGAALTRAELQDLARLKAPLVRVRGQWVHVSAAEIQAALRFWKEKGRTATVRDVVRLSLGVPGMTTGLAFDGVEATGWVGALLRNLEGHGAFEELAAPQGFRGTLRPYQLRGYSWLEFLAQCGFGACLADDMGLGKTVQALAVIQGGWKGEARRPTLLICPTSVVGNWEKEIARFTPDLPVLVHHGAGRAKGALQGNAGRYAIVISSYALLHRDLETLKEVDWSAVILDEAQNVKNPETRQARAARALAAPRRIALTGTPVENNVGDLWSLMEFLNPSFLGSQADFKRTFFVPIQAGRDRDATARLKRLTGPFILRRLKTDRRVIADLPDKMEMKVFCTLTREQASLYEAVVAEAMETLKGARSEGIERKGIILATLSKLKQVCNHPAQLLRDNSPLPGRSGKLARLTEMLEEVLEAGDRALVFTQFAEMGAMLRRHLLETHGREVLFLHGGVPKKQRDGMVERFQAGGAPIFILSLKAGGTGLNLTGANHVFHFDRWWNPAVENQATDRAFRIGQTRNVQVHKMLCAGTLEEKIDEMIERKKAVAEQVVGTSEAWLTALSTSQLRELMTLRLGAVAE